MREFRPCRVRQKWCDCDNSGQPEIAALAPKPVHFRFRVSPVVVEIPFIELDVVKTPDLQLEFRSYLSQFQRYKYFRFWRPYCQFWLSVVVAIGIECNECNFGRSQESMALAAVQMSKTVFVISRERIQIKLNVAGTYVLERRK